MDKPPKNEIRGATQGAGAETCRLSRIQSGGEVAEKRKRLSELETELLDMQNRQRRQFDEETMGKRDLLRGITEETLDIKVGITRKTQTIQYNSISMRNMEADTEKLRAKWQDINSQLFEFERSDTCPTCGQALPEEKLIAAREKALADFNRNKAEKLTEISTKGKGIKTEMEALTEDNSKLEKRDQRT